MSRFEDILEKACWDKDIPGAVLAAGNSSGTFNYAKAFGFRSLHDPSNPDPMQKDAAMWLASCTKFLTTVAAMQCVERGQLNLDSDVSKVLPELKGLQILTGFEEGSETPILVENHKIITLRHLLTHSSGLAYDSFHPLLIRYRAATNENVGGPLGGDAMVKDHYKFPLLFSPGDSWVYGVGIDWAGQMVERVNGNMSLEGYLQKNVFGPLDMKYITFHAAQHPEVMSRLVDMSTREGGFTKFGTANNPDGKVVYSSKTIFNPNTKDCYGGAGGFGSPCEYFKCLQSICANDGRLLNPQTVNEMFKPQLSEASRKALQEIRLTPEIAQCLGGYPPGFQVDHGIGGMMNLEDFGSRSKGSISWGGYPNLHWWIDRNKGVCGIWGSQFDPPGDAKTNDLFHLFQEEMYKSSCGTREKL